MADDPKPQQFFNWFGLPQELRDKISESFTTDIKLPRKKVVGEIGDTDLPPMRVTVRKGPVLNMLLVSRQFNAEYNDRIADMRTLAFTDRGGRYAKENFLHNNSLEDIKKVEIEILADCVRSDCKTGGPCWGAIDINETRCWITEMLPHLLSLEEVVVRICAGAMQYDPKADWPQDVHGGPFGEAVKKLLEIEKLNRLEIYQVYVSDVNRRPAFYKPHPNSAALWTKDGEWQALQGEQLPVSPQALHSIF